MYILFFDFDHLLNGLNANLISKGIRSISAAPDKTGQDSYLFSASNDFPLKDITVPRYTKGILVIASRDAIMIGVDLIGHKLIIGTRVNNVWTSGRIL